MRTIALLALTALALVCFGCAYRPAARPMSATPGYAAQAPSSAQLDK